MDGIRGSVKGDEKHPCRPAERENIKKAFLTTSIDGAIWVVRIEMGSA